THDVRGPQYGKTIRTGGHRQRVGLGAPDGLKAMVGREVVTITSGDPEGAAQEITKLLGVAPSRDDGALRMEVAHGQAFVPRLVRELTAPVDTVSLRRPSLDEIGRAHV